MKKYIILTIIFIAVFFSMLSGIAIRDGNLTFKPDGNPDSLVYVILARAGGVFDTIGILDTLGNIVIGSQAYVEGVVFPPESPTKNVVIGSQAHASVEGGIAIGFQADGSEGGLALGPHADGSALGVALGAYTDGKTGGTAVGYYADGDNDGVAVGANSIGYNNGVGIGKAAAANTGGVSIGSQSQANAYGIALGRYARAPHKGVSIGYYAGNAINNTLDPNKNIFIGYQAGMTTVLGDNNIIIGYNLQTPAANDSNYLCIGGLIYGDLSSKRAGIGTSSFPAPWSVEGAMWAMSPAGTTKVTPTSIEGNKKIVFNGDDSLAYICIEKASGVIDTVLELDTLGNYRFYGVITATSIVSGNGAITGQLTSCIEEVIKASTGNITAEECKSTLINNYGQGAANTQTLPTVTEGLNCQVVTITTGFAFYLDCQATDKFYLDGVALDDGDKISNATPVVGDAISIIAVQTGVSEWNWIARTLQGTWVDGG